MHDKIQDTVSRHTQHLALLYTYYIHSNLFCYSVTTLLLFSEYNIAILLNQQIAILLIYCNNITSDLLVFLKTIFLAYLTMNHQNILVKIYYHY